MVLKDAHVISYAQDSVRVVFSKNAIPEEISTFAKTEGQALGCSCQRTDHIISIYLGHTGYINHIISIYLGHTG